MSLRCTFCGKDWVDACWTEREAWSCGNNDGSMAKKCVPSPLPNKLQKRIDAAAKKLAALSAAADAYRATKSEQS